MDLNPDTQIRKLLPALFVNKKITDFVIIMKEHRTSEAKNVAAAIRKVREFRNYTQDYLASSLGISQNAYSKVELGYSKITLDRLFEISGILNIPVMELLEFDARKFDRKA